MELSEQIAQYARRLFDVIAFEPIASGKSLLVLGMESTPERNLDEFGRLDGDFQMYGFEKYVNPRLELLLSFIRGKGFFAEPVGRYGYPLQGEISLKVEAIRMGLGKRGKNTVVLHPEYGPRLRFMAIVTDAPLEPKVDPILTEEENPVCNGCSICFDACPVGVLEAYRMIDPSRCLSDSDRMPEENGRLVPCDKCLQLCPVGRGK